MRGSISFPLPQPRGGLLASNGLRRGHQYWALPLLPPEIIMTPAELKVLETFAAEVKRAEAAARMQGTVDVLSALVWACGPVSGKPPEDLPRMILRLFAQAAKNHAPGKTNTIQTNVDFYAAKLGVKL